MTRNIFKNEDWNASSVRTKLAARKAKRLLSIGFLFVFIAPLALYLLLTLFGTGGGLFSYFIWTILSLFSSVFQVAIPLAILAGIAWTIVSRNRPGTPPSDQASGQSRAGGSAAGNPELRKLAQAAIEPSTLASLEYLRTQAQESVSRRKRLFIPAGIAISFGLFFLMTWGGRWQASPGMFLPIMVGLGAAGGWFLATFVPEKDFAQKLKDTTIPRLLANFGEFHSKADEKPDISRLVETGVLPRHSRMTADMRISGIYRDRCVTITEITLERSFRTGWSTRWSIVFRGPLIELAASGPFGSTTIMRDAEAGTELPVSNGRALKPISIGDDTFDAIYATFTDNKAGARQWLTSAIGRRILTMADGKGFAPPFILLEGTQMRAGFHCWDLRNLLKPPNPLSRDVEAHVTALEAELSGIFSLVDALVEIEQAYHRADADRRHGP
ncbi:hypothetical protein [Enterovirga rhinocerotis]|uniref:DUF3137 domain-containing protein n=1 Tax=Enterovirga rhinocerotis TaxID=1339210 RepID=A0A4R7CAL6_9HYPH|nr:hypothetical protein [Enterovirga rhinocerotis]TDR94056.1 hypothetical protein EV668_1328 [Enterovirga rhinocerotis]